MFNVKIILASTRPGRKGPFIASWVLDTCTARKDLNVTLLDLAAINLPFFDEPSHPRLRKYEKQHTKDWSEKIQSADAIIIVTCEYNYGYPAPLKNALDYLFHEWSYKPVAFVSYGGIAGGTRAVQMLKQVVTAMKMMPIPEAVNISYFTRYFSADGRFVADDKLNASLEEMLHELVKWIEPLKTMRASVNL